MEHRNDRENKAKLHKQRLMNFMDCNERENGKD